MPISFKKKFLFTITIGIVLPVLFLGIGELLIRLYIHLHYGIPGNKYGIYIADKELGAVHRPNSYNTNSVINNWGFRNNEDIVEQKPKGALRIYCSGGSTTFCYNLFTEEAWPSLLQRNLRQSFGHEYDEVLNAGSICFAVAHEFALAKRFIPRLKPDAVILYGMGVNESEAAKLLKGAGVDFDELLRKKRWGVFPRNLDQARFIKRHSTLVKFYAYYVSKWLREHFFKEANNKITEAESIHPWVIANFEHTLRDYIAFLRNNGCQIVFVRYSNSGVNNWYFNNYIRIFRDHATAIAQSEGVIIYDFATVIEQHPQRAALYIDTGAHLTRGGAELLVNGLYEVILKLYMK